MPLDLEKLVKGEPLWDEKVNENLQAIEDYVKELEKVKASTCDVEIKGRTLKNLLGNKGNAIYKMAPVQNDLTYNNDRFVTSSVNIGTDKRGIVTFPDIDVKMGKKYIFLIDIYLKDNTDPEFWFWMGDKCDYYDDRSAFRYKKDASIKYSNHVSYRVFSPKQDLSTYCSFGSYNQPIGYKLECGYARLYELTDEEFDELLNLTPDEVAAKYPYVDNAKSVINPYIESKENILYDLRFDKGSYNEFGEFTETTGQGCSLLIKLEPGVYTMSSDGEINLQMEIKEWKRTSFGTIQRKNESADSKTFMIQTPGMYHLNISNSGLSGTDLEDKILKSLFLRKTNVVLCKGDKKKLSSECINSRIMFETTVYEGETIKRDSNGKYIKNSEWGEINLNGNDIKIAKCFPIMTGSTYTGYTSVEIEADSIGRIEHSGNILYDDYIIKYNGNIFQSLNNSNVNSYETDESFHWGGTGHTYRRLCLSLPKELTGWGDGYTPTEDEIKAFFMGWRMYGAFGPNSVDEPYWANSLSTTHKKGWLKLYCGIGDRIKTISGTDVAPYVLNSNVYECPTYMNNEGYVPYKLIYRKKLPTVEEVSTHGELICTENSVTNHSSGLVLNEEYMTMMYRYNNGVCNEEINTTSSTLLKYRADKILNVNADNESLFTWKNLTRNDSSNYITRGCGHTRILPDDMKTPRIVNVDYLISSPDTVTFYNSKISSSTNIYDELMYDKKIIHGLAQRLIDKEKEVDILNHKLSQISNPNLLINGDFKVWQRGESFTNLIGKYSADRWKTTQMHPVNINKGESEYGNTIRATAVNDGSAIWLYQPLENFNDFIGKYVTVSFYIRGINGFSGHMTSRFGNIGNPLVIDSNWRKITYTVLCEYKPSISSPIGLVIATLSTNLVKKDQGYELAQVKLELGKIATPFVPRSEAEELADCQRFYERCGSNCIGYGVSQNEISLRLVYKTDKRTPYPTIKFRKDHDAISSILLTTLDHTEYIDYDNTQIVDVCDRTPSGSCIKLRNFNKTVEIDRTYVMPLNFIAIDAEIY